MPKTNISTQPMSTPGITPGSVMNKKRCTFSAPRVAAASSSSGFSRSIDEPMASSMKGKFTVTTAMASEVMSPMRPRRLNSTRKAMPETTSGVENPSSR